MKGRTRSALTIGAAVVALAASAPSAQAADDCREGWYCDKEAAFNVKVPDGYEAKKRPVQNIAAQLTRRGESRGPNCPIVSEVHADSQLWLGIGISDHRGFWASVFAPPYFGDARIGDPLYSIGADGLPAGSYAADEQFLAPRGIVSLVEVTFRVYGKGPRLKARQAYYWTSTRDEPSSESMNHAASRAYFVNCTAIDEKESRPNFASELPKFRDVLERFETRQCYTDAKTGKPACFDEELPMSRLPQDRFRPTAAGDLSSLVELGARAAAMGAQ